MLVLIKITYCRDGQLIWLDVRFEKAVFSGLYRHIYLAVLSSLRQMYSSRQRTPGHRTNTAYTGRCPSGLSEGLAEGRALLQ